MAKQKMKTVDMSVKVEDMDVKEAQILEETVTEQEGAESNSVKKTKTAHVRSHKYHAAKANVDRTKAYPLNQAIELVTKTSYSKFTGTVVADLIVRDEKVSAEVAFPYSTGKTVRVAIASDELLAKVEAGVIDFDVLVTHPSFMPKIAKLAKILGPKGLMPNPKNNTVSTDPEKRAKEMSTGKTTVKTERKAPLIHIIIGKTTQETKELAANMEALVKSIGVGKIIKLTISATMSPGVRIDLTKFGV